MAGDAAGLHIQDESSGSSTPSNSICHSRACLPKNARNAARALGEKERGRSQREMLARAKWAADGVRKEGRVALRVSETARPQPGRS